MIELDVTGWAALLDAVARWGALALLFVPTAVLALAALVLRVRLAKRAAQRFGDDGSGAWLDHRRCFHGKLSLAKPRQRQCVARFRARKKQGYPITVALTDELRVLLEGGVEVRIPAATAVHFELGSRASLAENKVVAREGSGSDEVHSVEVVVKDGVEVWLIAHAALPVADGAMRSSSAVELTSNEGIELHFERPEPPETRFLGTFATLCFALTTQALFAFAEGWRSPLLLSQGLFLVLAITSLRNTRTFARALDGSP